MGKVAIVTGASSGIGAAVARQLSAAGANLVLTARRRDRLEAIAADLLTPVEIVEGDICSPSLAEEILTRARARFGGADILINNAGLLSIASIEDVDLDLLDRLIAVNLGAVIRFSYIFARAFRAQRSGAIVNVSSIGASLTVPYSGVYAATKVGVESFTAALRVELAGSGVKVGTVAPGSTATEILDVVRAHGEEPWSSDTAKLAADDVATAIRFLLEQPDGANIARLSIYSADERA